MESCLIGTHATSSYIYYILETTKGERLISEYKYKAVTTQNKHTSENVNRHNISEKYKAVKIQNNIHQKMSTGINIVLLMFSLLFQYLGLKNRKSDWFPLSKQFWLLSNNSLLNEL